MQDIVDMVSLGDDDDDDDATVFVSGRLITLKSNTNSLSSAFLYERRRRRELFSSALTGVDADADVDTVAVGSVPFTCVTCVCGRATGDPVSDVEPNGVFGVPCLSDSTTSSSCRSEAMYVKFVRLSSDKRVSA